MNEELAEFLHQNHVGSGKIARLDSLGAETMEDAWNLASPADLVWGVTRPGVMSPEQRRKFLVFVLESIEDKLTDARSKNILDKLRAKSPITEADAAAARAAAEEAAEAAADAASWASWAAAAAEAADAARAAARAAADAAADAGAADAAAWAAAWAAWAAADAAAEAAVDATAAADATTRENQARWIRTNFRLEDLQTN